MALARHTCTGRQHRAPEVTRGHVREGHGWELLHVVVRYAQLYTVTDTQTWITNDDRKQAMTQQQRGYGSADISQLHTGPLENVGGRSHKDHHRTNFNSIGCATLCSPVRSCTSVRLVSHDRVTGSENRRFSDRSRRVSRGNIPNAVGREDRWFRFRTRTVSVGIINRKSAGTVSS